MRYVDPLFSLCRIDMLPQANAEQLRKRLTEAEMNHARTTHDVRA